MKVFILVTVEQARPIIVHLPNSIAAYLMRPYAELTRGQGGSGDLWGTERVTKLPLSRPYLILSVISLSCGLSYDGRGGAVYSAGEATCLLEMYMLFTAVSPRCSGANFSIDFLMLSCEGTRGFVLR